MSMSKTTDDILNLDFDPDVLIDLIGKLSLDAIPLDVSDTLLKLENKMETSLQNPAISSAEYAPHLSSVACSSGYVPPPCEKTSLTEMCPPVNVEKDYFLSTVGLGPRTALKPPRVKRTSGKELSYILNRIEPPETAYDPVLEDPPSSPYAPVFVEDDVLCLPSDEFDAVVKGLLTTLCDKNTLPGGELSFPPVSLPDFQPIAESDFLPVTAVSDCKPGTLTGFQSAPVFDFHLAAPTNYQPITESRFQPTSGFDLGLASVADFGPAPVSDFQSAPILNIRPPTASDFQPLKASDFKTVPVSDFRPVPLSDFQPPSHTFGSPFSEIFRNPTSGNVIDIDLSTLDCRPKYDQLLLNEVSSDSDGSFPSLGSQEGESSQASSVDKFVASPDSGYTSCSSVISPCSQTDTTDAQCPYEFSEEEDRQIDELVAALLEVESSKGRNDVSSSVVPVLTGEDPEDYKERILNFLKEPLSAEEPLSPLTEGDSESPEKSSLENERAEETSLSFSVKSSPKLRELNKGFEFRYGSKSELRHSSLVSKLKLHTEKNKILKQIQDAQEQKRLKVIQVLDRKLKRAGGIPVDDIENKRRKVQCKEA